MLAAMPIFKTPRAPTKPGLKTEPNVRTTEADTKLRAGHVAATTGGATKTAVPALLAQWKKSTVEATAIALAKKELQPELDVALAKAGRNLNEQEAWGVEAAFFDRNASRVDTLTKKHLASFGQTPAAQEAIVTKAMDDLKSEITQYRDPFTPVAQNDAKARAREIVLWENADAMVLVDLFVDRPKALVVPKQKLMFPTAATTKTLDELGRIAAHVSDAFMASAGAKKPAGIWINAPQDVTLKQLHVHVGPNLPEWASVMKAPGMEGSRAIDLLRDPTARAAMAPVFKGLSAALVKTLGPSK
jgi:diadenosine tetraphosphate (Ap4A) HIT family hydrolase